MNDTFTPIHNEVLEALCKINLSPYEIRVLFCIFRKTYGFIDKKTKQRKKNDWISGSQISKMTNLDRRHVSRALKGLKNKHVISRDDRMTGFSKDFMKLMSSVEMTVISRDDKENVPLEMTPPPSRDDNLSSVEGHTKEKKETITKDNERVVKKQLACPLDKNKYPNLHKECVEYLLSCEEFRHRRFINRGKQFMFLHKILRAGFIFSDIDKTMRSVEKKYGDNNWDFSTLANWMEKGG